MTLVSDAHRFVFVHVPKSGGTSIKEALARCHDHAELRRGSATKHLTPAELRASWPTVPFDEYFSFAFVRNPFSYLVSFWSHKIENPTHPDHHRVARHQSFDRWVGSIEGRRSMTQTSYTHDDEGTPLVDFIGRFESLHTDFARVTARCGLPRIALGHSNRSDHGPVASYFSDRLARRVIEAFKDDFELLGYEKSMTGVRCLSKN